MSFNIFQIVATTALLTNAVLGVAIYRINPVRRSNQCFLITSLAFDFWMACLLIGSQETRPENLMFWMRYAGIASALLPFTFDLLRLAIAKPAASAGEMIRELWIWGVLLVINSFTCFHPAFVRGVDFGSDGFAQPQYGSAQWVYAGYWLIALTVLSVRCTRDFRRLRGVARTELQFILLASSVSIIVGVSLAQIIPLLTAYKGWIQFTPLCVVLLDGIMAYGIATRRIMAVSVVLQRSLSYALLISYLTVLYITVHYIVRKTGGLLFADLSYFAHLGAAIVVALSVAPANGWMQKVSNLLFINADTVDIDKVVQRASRMLRSVTTVDSLCKEFSELIQQSFGTSEALILLSPSDQHVQMYPWVENGSERCKLSKNSAVSKILLRDGKPVVKDMLPRLRLGEISSIAWAEMQEIDAEVAIGIISKKEMGGIVLLRQKMSGRIYDETEQHALQLLCDQLAVALENANLYTAVQNGKIYNDILLDSLTSGIVAVNSSRVVTVFNQRAQRLTGLAEFAVVDRPMDVLPPALIEGLETILNTQVGFRDRNLCIMLRGEEIPIRVSGAIFRSHTGKLLGALLAFDDMTVLRKMEEQIRRTDRLSSIGTLSAGMAHEIKNPLVTIKTFTQLLPQQYSDAEFRHTFFDLVGQEVKRIDTIVNRLLNFARPAKAALKPVSLHEIIENSLRLVEQQLAQHEISLTRHLNARRHIIEADAEQLNQTFINFFLNAIHAMNKGGTLLVRTATIKHSTDILQTGSLSAGDRIQVDVQDTGCGITPENLSKIFDPFFTTKEHGVGLGLSVSHGIIQEHSGTIDVESEKGKGTVFHVQFPLLKPQEKKEE